MDKRMVIDRMAGIEMKSTVTDDTIKPSSTACSPVSKCIFARSQTIFRGYTISSASFPANTHISVLDQLIVDEMATDGSTYNGKYAFRLGSRASALARFSKSLYACMLMPKSWVKGNKAKLSSVCCMTSQFASPMPRSRGSTQKVNTYSFLPTAKQTRRIWQHRIGPSRSLTV